MNIPAYTSPTLCIGRTYDAEKSTASGDIFPPGLPTKLINVNKFSFKYTVVKDSKDVNDLLDISGQLSLKIKANLLTVEGAGQFVKENKKEEGTTTLLAVMKCTTVTETIDGNVEPSNTTAGVGTHYVRSVTYGAELVARLKFKSTSTSQKDDIKGSAKGELALQAVNVGLEAALQKLTTECETASDLEVKYHSTGLPDKLPITIEGLTKLIETFPSRMKDINEGKGIPTMFELLPVTDIIPTAKTVLQDRVEEYEVEEMEGYFDDIRSALGLANTYQKNAKEKHQDVLDFITTTKKVEKVFRKAISTLGRSEEKKKLEECQEKYEEALDGQLYDDKFVQHWKQIYSSKIPTTSIKLPEGRALSLVLLGKTGNGKSKTGNSILGRQRFKASGAAKSVTKTCLRGQREDEREIDVIDTPGVLDTSAVSWMDKASSYVYKNSKVQNEILKEVARIFAMTPDGFDSFILVTRYGDRFTTEDAQALKMLHKLLGDEAFNNLILVLSHGDQAERDAEENGKTVDETLRLWLSTLPSFVQKFVAAINNRVFLFNNCLRPEKEPEEYKKQLSGLITLIDEMTKGRERFVHKLTGTSKAILEQNIKEALDESGINKQLKEMQKKEEELEIKKKEIKRREEESSLKAKKEKEEIEKRMKQLENDKKKQEALEAEIRKKEQERKEQKEKEDKEKRELEEQIEKANEAKKILEKEKSALITTTTGHQHRSGGSATKAIQDEVQSGGCYPGSATYVDIDGRTRRMESLKLGDEVQVLINEEIRFEPVITFIHHHPEVMQEFLKITTLKKKILKITEDHLMFVEKEGQAAVIPARDVSIGDTVYVKGDQGVVDKDAVQSISTVIEKGVYAPVTLSGTILVNDVHTSCYFDVLSHKWSHRAMGAARAVYYVSPWMLQWVSGVGEMDGFPGWCRLAHKMLTFMD